MSANCHVALLSPTTFFFQLKEPRMALKHVREAVDKLLRIILGKAPGEWADTEALLLGELQPAQLAHVRSLAIGYENISCCQEYLRSGAHALASHERAVAIVDRHFSGEPLQDSLSMRTEQLQGAAQGAQPSSSRRHHSKLQERATGGQSGRAGPSSGRGGGPSLKLPGIKSHRR